MPEPVTEMGDDGHVAVLVDAAIEALVTDVAGTYVDATFGRGGHTRALLAKLDARAKLVAIDRDPAAALAAERIQDPRFAFVQQRFSAIDAILDARAIPSIDGALLDLGISSPQIDDPARGFSFRFDGPLDMRMDPSDGESAAEYLARASERELTEALRDYGEERRAQSVAKAIAATRAVRPLTRTRDLARVVAQAVGARTRGDWGQDPATRTFQALRLQVNGELDELRRALPRFARRLCEGGRLVVIAFHSLEDRIVKRFFASASQPFAGDARLSKLPLKASALPEPPIALCGRAIKPAAAEIAANPRARSAVMRVAQRTGAPWPPALDDPAR